MPSVDDDWSAGKLSLFDDIRPALIRQEETIIFSLIERSQYNLNLSCYKEGVESVLASRVNDVENPNQSLLDYFLSKTEGFQAELGRYSSADEHPFTKVPQTLSRFFRNQSPIKPNSININDRIKNVYLTKILPKVCTEGEDVDNFGSACSCDITVLQALSKRIHYGKFVAEAKYRQDKETFRKLIEANDAQGIYDALTFEEVERKVIERVRFKASHYGNDGASEQAYKVDPEIIAMLYEQYLIPLNKEVQVQYLLQRLNRPPFSFYAPTSSVPDHFSWGKEGKEVGKIFFKYARTDEPIRCESVSVAFQKVVENQTAFAIVPIEHAHFGIYKETLLCLSSSNLKVTDCSVVDKERYLVVGQHMDSKAAYSNGAVNRVILLFSTKHESGALLNVLHCLKGFNLCCLESMPTPTLIKDYMFYCEIEVAIEDASLEDVLQSLEKQTSSLIVLGAYFQQ